MLRARLSGCACACDGMWSGSGTESVEMRYIARDTDARCAARSAPCAPRISSLTDITAGAAGSAEADVTARDESRCSKTSAGWLAPWTNATACTGRQPQCGTAACVES